jgi:hypothetical protein
MASTVSKLSGEILVNTATESIQTAQRITSLSNGGFVVTWQDFSFGVGGATGDSDGTAIKAQVFAANGTRVGSELLVNTATTFAQSVPQITALADGGFVVTWEDNSAGAGGAPGDNDDTAVKAQVFAADGAPVGSELLVNTAVTSDQEAPRITALANGGFVVTWHDNSQGAGGATGDGSSFAVKAQVFAANGARVGSELLVNIATGGFQLSPQITALSSGGFVVAWEDNSQGAGGAPGDSDQQAVKAQVFLADGTRVGPELLVNTATTNSQHAPEITALSNGGFVVTWNDNSGGAGGAAGDNDDTAIKAQVFAADGTRVGSELLVNTAVTNDQEVPRITALSNGGFVVAWEDLSQGVGGATGDSSRAVKMQVFAADGTRVGSEILVNTATDNEQFDPQVTALSSGAFVVTWTDDSGGVGGATGDSDNYAVKAQVFLADGTRVGSELRVNTATDDIQGSQQIAALPNGGFVVTWGDRSLGVGGATGDGSSFAVKAQVFAVDINITGDGGNNTLTSTPANETIDGLGGDDTAVFSGNRSSYTLKLGDGAIFLSGPDGTDKLSSIEHLQFADGTTNLEDGSALFDTPFYLSRSPDVFQAGVDPLGHFNTFGFHEGRDPNDFFDTSFYLAVNQDVRVSGVNPLDHFHQVGWKEGRDPGPGFDTKFYLLRNPDVAAAGIDPLEHFLQFGQFEGRKANPAIGTAVNGFDAQFYLSHNPDVAAAGVDPLLHYDVAGRFEGRNPNAYFDTAGYLSHYADVAAAGVNPLQHYEQFGWLEGRDPSAGFDTLGYLAANPDVAAAHVNPLDHFLNFGVYEGRHPVSDGLFH